MIKQWEIRNTNAEKMMKTIYRAA